MSYIHNSEIDRKYRVLKQTLSMHTFLSQKYKLRATILDVALITCATAFCATTFVGDDFYSMIGIDIHNSKFLLGGISIIAFLASIISLRIDWKGLYTNHNNAVDKLSDVVALFRDSRSEEKLWASDKIKLLSDKYNISMSNIIQIPPNQFVKLKAKHIRKIEISKLVDQYPGSTLLLLKFKLTINIIIKLFKK